MFLIPYDGKVYLSANMPRYIVEMSGGLQVKVIDELHRDERELHFKAGEASDAEHVIS